MNRKFFNGLLLLALATGGVGTFTSCTDHEQDFQNKVLEGQKDLSDEIAAIRTFLGEPFENSTLDERIKAVTDARIKACEDRLDAIERDYATKEYVADEIQKAIDDVKLYVADIFKNYYTKEEIEDKIGTLQGLIEDVDAKAELNKAAIANLDGDLAHFVGDVQELFSRFALIRTSNISSVIVERTFNPVFGTLNLPIGIESNMLINYYAKAKQDVSFPSGTGVNEGVQNELFGTSGFQLPYQGEAFKMTTGEEALETLGTLYLTINPLERNFAGQGFQLVKSNGEALPSQFIAEESNDVLSFGYTRGDNGLYKAQIVPEEGGEADLIDATRFVVDAQLKTAFKNVIKNHGKEDLAMLAKAIYSQFNGTVPAYAAKVTWDEPVVDGVTPDTIGTMAADGQSVTRSVISGYDLAVASFNPLSYATNPLDDIEDGINKRLPVIGSLKDRIDQVFNYLHNHLDFGFKPVTVDNISIDLSKVKVSVSMKDVTIDLSGLPVYKADKDGNPIMGDENIVGVLGDNAKITLGYDGTAVDDPNGDALKPLAEAIENAIKDMLNGEGEDSLKAQINSQLKSQIEKIVSQVNEQLEGVQTKVYDSLASIQNRIDAELNGSLGSAAQSLVDLYDAFARKINDILDDPNAYLQVLMAYEGTDGGIHHLSTTPSDPTYVDKGALQFFMTSYNFELVVPSFKKYVAITKVDGANADAALNSKAGSQLNQVISGSQQRLAFNAAALESGKTYEIFYQSLDFRGFTSTRTYYIKVK